MHHHGSRETTFNTHNWHNCPPNILLRGFSEHLNCTNTIRHKNIFLRNKQENVFENLFPAGATPHMRTATQKRKIIIRCWIIEITANACLYTMIEIFMTYGFQWMGLTSWQWLSEREDHVMCVAGATYKVRYRPVQANCAMAKLVVSTFVVCLYSLCL